MRPESFRSIYRTALVRRDTLTDAYVARHNVRAGNLSELAPPPCRRGWDRGGGGPA